VRKDGGVVKGDETGCEGDKMAQGEGAGRKEETGGGMKIVVDEVVVRVKDVKKRVTEGEGVKEDGVGKERSSMGEVVGIYREVFQNFIILLAEQIPLKRILIKSLITNQTET